MVDPATFVVGKNAEDRPDAGEHLDVPHGHAVDRAAPERRRPLGFGGGEFDQVRRAVPLAHLRVLHHDVFIQHTADKRVVAVVNGNHRFMEGVENGDTAEGYVLDHFGAGFVADFAALRQIRPKDAVFKRDVPRVAVISLHHQVIIPGADEAVFHQYVFAVLEREPVAVAAGRNDLHVVDHGVFAFQKVHRPGGGIENGDVPDGEIAAIGQVDRHKRILVPVVDAAAQDAVPRNGKVFSQPAVNLAVQDTAFIQVNRFVVFDCDDLKLINDFHGHDKGDIYLKTSSRLICRIFEHSPVFRIGGDEFAVVMENSDFDNRDELVKKFDEAEKEINSKAENSWEEVHVAFGIAVHDPKNDDTVNDTARRADKIMYQNKKLGKEKGN